MSDEATRRDERLMDVIREATAARDAVPEHVLEAAKAVWTWRTIDAELAALAHDSMVDDDALAGVRGTATVRALSFTAGDRFVELEVGEDGERRSLIGQVMPPPVGPAGGPGRHLVVERVDAPPVAVELDELGRFAADRLPAGLVRLRVDLDGERALVTEWVAI